MIADTLPVAPADSTLIWCAETSPCLASAVRRELDQSGYLALRGVKCDVVGGVARLFGPVPSYYLKQLAQHIAGEVQGIDRVLNEIDVAISPGRQSEGIEGRAHARRMGQVSRIH